MALKFKISKTAFNKLTDELKELYVEDGNAYKLDVDGIEHEDSEAVAELKRAKDRETEARKEAQQENKDLKKKVVDLEAAGPNQDIKTLEKAHKSEIASLNEKHSKKLNAREAFIKKQLLESSVDSIANKFTKPSLMKAVIAPRLTVEFDADTDEPVLKVLGADGKPTVAKLEELQKEFVENKEYADMLIASKASGGAGAAKGQGQGGAQPNNNQPLDLSKASPKDGLAAMGIVITK